MKNLIWLSIVLLWSNIVYAQNKFFIKQENLVSVSTEVQDKILSGLLIEKVSQKQLQLKSGSSDRSNGTTNVVIYFSNYPSGDEMQQLRQLGIQCYQETWTPPVGSHPLGYMVASLPVDRLNEALSLPFLKKMDTAEHRMTAMNNNATRSVKANLVWNSGYRGSGVKIGILDSGIDITYAGTDLPGTIEFKDYSFYPLLDDDVANKITGHGTHVAATALGRGVLSKDKSSEYNGEGSFAGAAPGASLTFLKIGMDTTSSAEDAPIIAAIDAAVKIYHVDILSMSYGGWSEYHDGTSAVEQKVDWAYNQGVPFFLSGGNSADDERHWSGTIGANSESDFIEITVSDAATNDTRLRFNLVWSDGNIRKDIDLQYFDNTKNPIADITFLPTTESVKGTESKFSYSNFYVPAGNSTYYLKIINHSSSEQFCHIFEDWAELLEGNDNVWFKNSDPYYTAGSPSMADYGFAVGAYVSRDITYDYTGSSWVNNGYITDSLALFSSRGPRVDGKIKPDICAPGSMTISLRDKDVYTAPSKFWIDNDGILGEGEANYYRMHGTSMACPLAAGCAALYLEQKPDATPQEVYDAYKNNAFVNGLGIVPNNKWGAGKLNMANVFNIVALLSPKDGFQGISPNPTLTWEEKPNALSYKVQVSKEVDFNFPIVDLSGIDTNFVVIEGLDFNTTYYWRVQCVENSGNSGWSQKWSFTTGGVPAEAGYALWFDGVNDFVTVSHSPIIDEIENNDIITIEAWAYVNKWSANLFPIVEKLITGIGWGWSFQLHNSSGIELGLIWSTVNQPTIPSLKSWNHVAVSYSKAEGKARFYLNGEMVGEKDFIGDIPDSGEGDPFQIGVNLSGGDEYASGIIDEIRIWKEARTGKQIHDNMYMKLSGNEPNLVAVFTFDEGKGFNLSDISGNAPNGDLKNGPIWVVSTIPYSIPETPELISPADDAGYIPVDAVFMWNQIAPAETYYLQLADDSLFNNIIFSDSTLTSCTYSPGQLPSGTIFYWRVKAKNIQGSSEWSEVWSFNNFLTGIDQEKLLKEGVVLNQNYPNPFKDITTITYHLPGTFYVSLKVYDILGNEIAVLVDGKQSAGKHSVKWDINNQKGKEFFYRLKVDDNIVKTKKMVIGL